MDNILDSNARLCTLLNNYVSCEESAQIRIQFCRETWCNDEQVLWTGVPRDYAQKWADERGRQTLTTAMGPLMQKEHSSGPRNGKTNKAWKRYIRGASALFAARISGGNSVIVLTRPPPVRFNPSGETNYQVLEEPILKGEYGHSSIRCIYLVHPTVPGAEDFLYQVWPFDRTNLWLERFGHFLESACTERPSTTASPKTKLLKKAKKLQKKIKKGKTKQAKRTKKAENLRKAEEAKKAKQMKKADNLRQVEEAKKAKQAKKAENLHKEEEAKKAKQAKNAENLHKEEEAKKAAPSPYSEPNK